MGIKKDEKTNTWSVTYSKRPKGGGSPISLRRIGLKSEAEAKRVERELVIELEKKLLDKRGETWEKVAIKFLDFNKDVNWTYKTHENYESTLRAHTFKKWGEKTIERHY